MNRSLAVTRTHLLDRRTVFGLPILILALIAVIAGLIWVSVSPGGRVTGGAASIYIFVFAISLQNLARGFPFALGMGVSRRSFAVGTLWAGGLIMVIFGALMFVLSIVERETGGWWASARFFYFSWMDHSGPVGWWLVLTVPFMATFMLGALFASVYLRWGLPGVVGAAIVTIVILGSFSVVETWTHHWHATTHWLGGLNPLEASGLTLALTVILMAAGWSILRRVTL